MSTTNQYSKLFQVLSEVLDTCTVPEVISALNTLRAVPASSLRSVPPSKKRQVADFTTMITQGLRARKPDYLKKAK
jgi:hypothetical protein